MGSKGFMWHAAQIFQILAAGAWAITCLIPAFTVPRDSTSSINNDEASGRRRTYLLTLWIGTAIGWFFFAAGIVFYIALILSDRRARKKHGKPRNCTVWVTTALRLVGLVAGVALGAYYAHRRLRRIYPALALAFVFALACLVAIVFTVTKRHRGGAISRGHHHVEKGHHHQPARRGWRSRF
ncbi:MFS transporter [Microdochium nivale]|nr:MFS transporter [Microdochium nivale]